MPLMGFAYVFFAWTMGINQSINPGQVDADILNFFVENLVPGNNAEIAFMLSEFICKLWFSATHPLNKCAP